MRMLAVHAAPSDRARHAIVVLVLAPAPTLAARPLDSDAADQIRTYVQDVFG